MKHTPRTTSPRLLALGAAASIFLAACGTTLSLEGLAVDQVPGTGQDATLGAPAVTGTATATGQGSGTATGTSAAGTSSTGTTSQGASVSSGPRGTTSGGTTTGGTTSGGTTSGGTTGPAATTAPSEPASTPSEGATSGPAPASAAPGAAPSQAPAGPVTPGKPPSNHPGVTDDEIAIGISLFKVGNAGASLGIDVSYGNTEAQAQAVVDWVNANGGIAGRTVRPVYYTVDFGRAGQVQDGQFEQEACAKWTEDDKVYAAINTTMARNNILTCLAERDVIGLHDGLPVDDALAKKYFEHFYTPSGVTLDRTLAFQVKALGERGYFQGAKVGMMYFNDPAYQRVVDEVFIPLVMSYGATDVVLQSAPRGGTQEAQLAVAAFQREGVTHVTFFGEAGLYPLFFMRAAENQVYRPQYFLNSNHQLLTLESGAPPQQLQNMIGQGWYPALDVTTANDPGPVSANNELCLQIQRDAGQDMSERGAYLTAHGFCSGLFFLRTVLGQVTELSTAGVTAVTSGLGGGFESPGVFATRINSNQHDAPSAYRDIKFQCASAGCGSGVFVYDSPATVMP